MKDSQSPLEINHTHVTESKMNDPRTLMTLRTNGTGSRRACPEPVAFSFDCVTTMTLRTNGTGSRRATAWRTLISNVVAAAALICGGHVAAQTTFPSKPLRIIVP